MKRRSTQSKSYSVTLFGGDGVDVELHERDGDLLLDEDDGLSSCSKGLIVLAMVSPLSLRR